MRGTQTWMKLSRTWTEPRTVQTFTFWDETGEIILLNMVILEVEIQVAS
jgi:hypothetical protein